LTRAVNARQEKKELKSVHRMKLLVPIVMRTSIVVTNKLRPLVLTVELAKSLTLAVPNALDAMQEKLGLEQTGCVCLAQSDGSVPAKRMVKIRNPRSALLASQVITKTKKVSHRANHAWPTKTVRSPTLRNATPVQLVKPLKEVVLNVQDVVQVRLVIAVSRVP
jgi:hypothetical protein